MLRGTADPGELVAARAELADFATAAECLPGAEVLQALCEIGIGGRERSLPSGLHPTNPPTCVLQVWSCPDSPWGPFRLAQARVGCRSGLRPRGFVQGFVADDARAVGALRSRWGFPAVLGEVVLRGELEASPSVPPSEGTVKAKAPTAEELAAVLAQHDGNVAEVARHFGKARFQLYRWMQKHGLRR